MSKCFFSNHPLSRVFSEKSFGEKLTQKRQKRMATFLIEIVENYPKQMNKFSFKFLFSFHRGHRLHKDFLTEHSERWKTVKMRKAKKWARWREPFTGCMKATPLPTLPASVNLLCSIHSFLLYVKGQGSENCESGPCVVFLHMGAIIWHVWTFVLSHGNCTKPPGDG